MLLSTCLRSWAWNYKYQKECFVLMWKYPPKKMSPRRANLTGAEHDSLAQAPFRSLTLIQTCPLPGSSPKGWSPPEGSVGPPTVTDTNCHGLCPIYFWGTTTTAAPTHRDVFPHSSHSIYFCKMEATMELCLLAGSYRGIMPPSNCLLLSVNT